MDNNYSNLINQNNSGYLTTLNNYHCFILYIYIYMYQTDNNYYYNEFFFHHLNF